jgi:hypothetical protein
VRLAVAKPWQAAVVSEAPALTESALVVLVPEAEPAVSSWRSDLDPSAALGVPAHVTLLYPFVEPTDLDDTVLSTVARAIGVSRPFDFALDEVRWFGDTVMWLAPSPPAPFIVLTQALVDAFPDCPRYGGSVGDEIIPHLTVADGAPLALSQRAARAVREALPLRARAQAVALLVGGRSPMSWRVARKLELG